ncbi:PD-(D/E)XK motif protein [Streptomyces diacarni]|uniref:PD-(D/E)XK motif protein n=1 Tax=Streptomyces diacarni TaxID=2800381 RepID=UPI0033E2D98B
MDVAELNLETTFKTVLAADSGRMIIIRNSPFLFAAVNNRGKPALLTRVSLDLSQVLNDGRGFTVQTRRSTQDDFVQITSNEDDISSMFLKLVSFILERVGDTKSVADGAQALISSIEEFRNFTDTRHGRISESLVRGTFAELLLLRTLIAFGFPPESAIASWTGPFAREGIGAHDFTFADGSSIEVKSKRQAATSVRVSSVNQLVPSDNTLDLVVLPIEDDRRGVSRSIGFREYAQETETFFSTIGSTTLNLWLEALNALGLDLSDEWYDRYRFIVGEWKNYQVTDGFPFLDVTYTSRGIIDIRYSLDLISLRPFEGNFNRLISEIGAKQL